MALSARERMAQQALLFVAQRQRDQRHLFATDLDRAVVVELARLQSRMGDHLSRWLARTARRFFG